MYEQGPDDPILTSRPGVKAPQGMLSEVTTKGGWQFSRSEWMDILRDAHAELRKDPNSPTALRALAEFRTAFADAAQSQEPSTLATLWQGTKDIFRASADWLTQDVPSAIGDIVFGDKLPEAVGQATGLGNVGGVINTDPTAPVNQKAVESPWGRGGGGIPGYFGSATGPVTNPEFVEASVPEKLERVVQALPTNVPYNVTRNLFEGTGALNALPWNRGAPESEPVGTYETTKNVLDMAMLPLGLGEAGGIPRGSNILPEAEPFAISRGVGRAAKATPGKIGSGLRSIAERVKAVYDMPKTLKSKMEAATAVDRAREVEVGARADWHRARTEAQIIKNQGGTAAEQAAAKIKTDLANVRLQQAQQRLQTLQQEHTIGGRKGEVIEQQIERGPAQTEGVELSNELKRLRIEQMQGRGGRGTTQASDWEGLVDDATIETPQAPAPKPAPKPKAPRQPTPAPPVPELLDEVSQTVRRENMPTPRSIEPPTTKSGNFEFPQFEEGMNIAQKKKWPRSTDAEIELYLRKIAEQM